MQPDKAPVVADRDDEDRSALDLGSLVIPSLSDGVNLRVKVDDQGWVTDLHVDHGGSSMQLGVFAANPGHAIWAEVRDEIRAALFEDGEAARPVPSAFGTDLLTQVLGDQGPVSMRFIGIDGPGWMVRGVIQGAAAADPQGAEPFLEFLRGLRVVRGDAPLPERVMLPMRLPDDLRTAAASPNGSDHDDPSSLD